VIVEALLAEVTRQIDRDAAVVGVDVWLVGAGVGGRVGFLGACVR